MHEEWQTLDSQEIHRNPWYRLKQDNVVMPSGQQGKYTYIDRYNAVIIAALDSQQQIYLVGQYRYPIKKFSWELPKGTLEKANDDILESAKRELLEEVGLEAKKWDDLGAFFLDSGLTNQNGYLFLAQDLTQKQAMPDYTEFLTAKKVSFKDFEKMIQENEITDCHSIAAYYKIKQYVDDKQI